MFYAVVCFNAIVKRGEPGLCREAALYKLAVIIIIIIIIILLVFTTKNVVEYTNPPVLSIDAAEFTVLESRQWGWGWG